MRNLTKTISVILALSIFFGSGEARGVIFGKDPIEETQGDAVLAPTEEEKEVPVVLATPSEREERTEEFLKGEPLESTKLKER